jgi:hypothetical protein
MGERVMYDMKIMTPAFPLLVQYPAKKFTFLKVSDGNLLIFR